MLKRGAEYHDLGSITSSAPSHPALPLAWPESSANSGSTSPNGPLRAVRCRYWPPQEATMRTVVAVILFVGSLSQVNASGCNHVITRPIRMTAGSSCWSFTGIGTTFVGTFRAGQRIAARASGQFSTETASGQIEKSWGHWNLSVSGPGGFLADSTNGGPLVTTLPASGRYSFDIGPCAVWGAPGKVEVCAR